MLAAFQNCFDNAVKERKTKQNQFISPNIWFDNAVMEDKNESVYQSIFLFAYVVLVMFVYFNLGSWMIVFAVNLFILLLVYAHQIYRYFGILLPKNILVPLFLLLVIRLSFFSIK